MIIAGTLNEKKRDHMALRHGQFVGVGPCAKPYCGAPSSPSATPEPRNVQPSGDNP